MRALRLALGVIAAAAGASAAPVKPRLLAAFPVNLAYADLAAPERQRDPVEQFGAIFERTSYDRRYDLQPAFAQMDAELENEIEQRRRQGLELSRDVEKRLRTARGELELSLTALRNASEENWAKAVEQTRLRLQDLRTAYAATKTT